jgi:DNA-binding MarR family transcriptional regulator
VERQAAAKTSLSLSQGRILAYLDRDVEEASELGMRTGDLAQSQGLAISTMTRNLDLLEKKQWVQRSQDPEDRRTVRVRLTDSGRQISRMFWKITQAQLTEAFGKLHPSDTLEQAIALSKVAAALEKVADRPN